MLSCSKWVSRLRALKHTQRVHFRIRSGGPGGGNPLNTKYTIRGMVSWASMWQQDHLGVLSCLKWASWWRQGFKHKSTPFEGVLSCSKWWSRWRQPFEHKNTPFEAWSRAQSGHRGDGKISNTKTHPFGCGFMLEVDVKATEGLRI